MVSEVIISAKKIRRILQTCCEWSSGKKYDQHVPNENISESLFYSNRLLPRNAWNC
ncbi:hypothetical protein B4U79_15691 [Dinothrombium tinctorium]|uniref:Uncharacterized protein n=1 Tax=Dinothrombium tinctorium TaxID=1965070 RepID=A0A443QAY9_9ACAR|nr:hypothetical protein B4U79_15691 [Dinothrombium tinctorium]